MAWKLTKVTKYIPKLSNPILIEGLPGIGNVGKVAVDFMIEEIGAKKLYEITSFSLPHSVFVAEDNLVELPVIEVYYKKFGGKRRDLLLLAGDIQPIDEQSCYEFCYAILDLLREFGGKEIVTIGGIGLPTVPERPKVYCTGNTKQIVERYKRGVKVSEKLYGIVGPIVGVTGLLTGLASDKNMEAVCFLAETYGHPLYLGMKGSQEVLKILDKKLGLKLNLKALNKEIKEIEEEIIKRTDQLAKGRPAGKVREVSYIG
ncbi:PAC2 family protein [Candidatus Woesearchaeota archaeon]|nr:PAC2 family protein [Candidatus Woesearchaeota archaeon]